MQVNKNKEVCYFKEYGGAMILNNFKDAVDEMYINKKKIMIVGLTGRTGSGCTKVASILRKSSISDLDIKIPKTRDYDNSDERKQQVIYEFMKATDNWKSFTIIEGSTVILTFILEQGYDKLIDYLKNLNESECRFYDNKIYEELKDIEHIFKTYNNSYRISDYVKDKNVAYYSYYTNELSKYKDMIYSILSKHICYPNKDEKAQLYTYLMQVWGNNIRASGSPYCSDFSQRNYYDIAKRMDDILKIIIESNDNESSIRICLDALRNPYEVYYFKDNYKNFHLISVSTEDYFRKGRLSYLTKQEQEALESTECPTHFDSAKQQFYHQNVQGCVEISDIHIFNPDITNEKYYFLTEQLIKYIALILHPGLVTPTHIERCMQLAYNAKYNSGCLSRQVGAVITGNDFSIRAVGWNDVPKGQVPCNLRSVEGYCANKDEETFSNFELCDADFDAAMKQINISLEKIKDKGGRSFSYCFKDIYNGYKGTTNQVFTRSLHAEENAFLQISKYGGSGIKGGYLFTTASPCELCAKKAYQLGITNIFYIEIYPGISINHVLSFGSNGNPNMNLFYGAIGNAYISLYEPRMSQKDELELISGFKVKEVVKPVNAIKELPIESNIKYNKMMLSLTYNANIDIINERHVELEVIGEPINHIEKEITWTGSEYLGSEVSDESNEFSIIDSERKTSPYRYIVEFNKSILKGERAKYTVKTKVSDADNEMQPFLSHTVKNPTDELIIKLVVPKKTIGNVKGRIYRDTGREIPVNVNIPLNKEEESEKEIFIYSIKNPNLFFTYCIEWDWNFTA